MSLTLNRLWVYAALIAVCAVTPFLSAHAGTISATRCSATVKCATGATCRSVPAYVLVGEAATDKTATNACLTEAQYTAAKAAIASAGGNTGDPTAGGNTDPKQEGTEGGTTLQNPLKVGTLQELLSLVLKAVVQIGVIILTLALIWTGFKFVAARGNEEAIRNAKTALMWTVIGGLLLLGAEAISLVLQATVGKL